MIKRISPNSSLKISIKDIKQKQLKPQQVIDPNLSQEEKAAFQKQLHKETFVEQALKRVQKEVKFDIDDASVEREEELTDDQISEFLREEEIRRGTKIFDPTAFGKAVEKTIPGLRPKK